MIRSIDNGNDDDMCSHKLCCFEMCQIWVEFPTCNLQLVSIYNVEVQKICAMLDVHYFDLWNSRLFMDIAKKKRWTRTILSISKG